MLSLRISGGFTLVEALIALVLLLAGLAAAGIVLLQSVQHERESANRRAALRLAASLADEMRSGSRALASSTANAQSVLPAGAVAHVEPEESSPATYVVRIEWPVAGVGSQRLVLPVTP